MIMKETKIAIALSITRDDLEFLRQVGNKYGAKNNSQAFRYLIERQKSFERQLNEIKNAAVKENERQSYQAVRAEQIKKEIEKIKTAKPEGKQ